jgi:hypothetical protein
MKKLIDITENDSTTTIAVIHYEKVYPSEWGVGQEFLPTTIDIKSVEFTEKITRLRSLDIFEIALAIREIQKHYEDNPITKEEFDEYKKRNSIPF